MTDQTTGHTRVALVTGATSGIGRAVALKLASDGFAVVVHGRDAERGAATVRAIEEAGGHARFASADLGNPDEVARLADDAGEVDVLVNNAGFSWFGATADLDVATFDALFASNVQRAARCKHRIPVPRRPKIARWTCSGDGEARVLQRSTAKCVRNDVDGHAPGASCAW